MSGPMTIDAEFLRVHARFIKLIGMPVCRYCDKACRVGSVADPHWPHMDGYSYHKLCRRKAKQGVHGD